MTTPIGRIYAEKILNELGLKDWFLNEDVASVFPPESTSLSRVLSQMVRNGYLEKEIVKQANNGNTYKWRVISLIKTKPIIGKSLNKTLLHEDKVEVSVCQLSYLMGIRKAEQTVTGRICRGSGHGSGVHKKINAWSRNNG